MPNDRSINYVELPCVDLDAAEAFYTTVFAWTFVDYGPEYRAFNDGAFDGGFYYSDRRSGTENGAALIVLYSDDLEKVAVDVEKAGGTIHKAIFSFPGGRRFHFLDPHGNELAIWSDK